MISLKWCARDSCFLVFAVVKHLVILRAFPIILASIHDADGRLTAKSREVSKLRDSGLDFFQSFRNLTVTSAAALRLRDFTRSCGKTSYRSVKKPINHTIGAPEPVKQPLWILVNTQYKSQRAIYMVIYETKYFDPHFTDVCS